jgi:Family of unknown function (DUF6298)
MYLRCAYNESVIRLAFAAALLSSATAAAQPIAPHPDNPRYFLYEGRPTVLITSGEHYGAVINLDFDFVKYLRTLAADRLNLTRVFPGAYREVPGSFNIERNTLAPAAGRFICPWPRAGTTGAFDGHGKFDLTRWDEAYFNRLRDFAREAARHGVIVEMSLFCPYYRDDMWNVSPLNAANNVNGIGDLTRTDVLTLKDSRMVEIQDAMVRKIVTELRGFDNVYYEICNEPYSRDVGVTAEWQAHISGTIRATNPHALIAQNIANGSTKIDSPNPLVGLFNFHYTRPPDAVAMNEGLNKAIGLNETGFDGADDATYRIQGWDFLIAGGSLYNNLDYSFAVGHENGTYTYPSAQPGGGSAALRRQLRTLREFFDRLPFLRMKPANDVIKGEVPPETSVRALGEAGKTYAVYVHHGRVVPNAKPRYQVDRAEREIDLRLDLPGGAYAVEWLQPRSGARTAGGRVLHAGGVRSFTSPTYTEDIVFRVARQ